MDHQHLFTCISCSIAFLSAEEQRLHYRSDHHRYNMKRRVASLPPVSVSIFNQKVLDKRGESAIMSSPKGSTCEVCNKTYASENAYRSHLNSKRHKENVIKGLPSASVTRSQSSSTPTVHAPSLLVSEDADEDEIERTIDMKIAAARARISNSSCLFCEQESSSLEQNLTHMASVHSFFIPDAEYLVDISGLISYLGEKIAVGNACLYCSTRGKEFRSLDAVRKHMVDKSHCKISYDTEEDRLEYSDYYDFTASYPEKSKTRQDDDEEWEDTDDEVSADEAVDDEGSDGEESLPDNQVTYGDTEYELVLPSGARIGHRTLRRYYAQSFRSSAKNENPKSGTALVRQLLKDKNAALVPRKGGFGAFGSGAELVKARNPGEAREAGRHVREFRDQKRREDFKTRVAFIHNHQKHYRDPLLQ